MTHAQKDGGLGWLVPRGWVSLPVCLRLPQRLWPDFCTGGQGGGSRRDGGEDAGARDARGDGGEGAGTRGAWGDRRQGGRGAQVLRGAGVAAWRGRRLT